MKPPPAPLAGVRILAVEQFGAGPWATMLLADLGAEVLKIVCASLSAFGRTGDRASEPGYDYLMQGYAGWMSLTGEPDAPPQKTGLSLVDLSAVTMAALGLMAAILRARSTGRGCDVDVSLFDTALSKLGYVAAWHLTKEYQPRRMADSSHPSQIPSQVLPTRDGWLVVMCAKEKFYQSLVRLTGCAGRGGRHDPRNPSPRLRRRPPGRQPDQDQRLRPRTLPRPQAGRAYGGSAVRVPGDVPTGDRGAAARRGDLTSIMGREPLRASRFWWAAAK
jgi:crotonobetainyl-CoA:carnitine CoA-transferase CaiB-like acyl-CoA transferase